MTAAASGKTAAALLAAVVALGACSHPGADPEPLPSVSVDSEPTTKPPSPVAPSSPSPRPTALTRAAETPARFWRVVDRLSSNPNSDLTDLTTVSRGLVAAQWRTTLTRYRYNNWKQDGHVAVVRPSAKQLPGAGKYEVTACVDVSRVDLVDNHGKSVVKANRPDRVEYRYTVQDSAGKLFVIEEKAIKKC